MYDIAIIGGGIIGSSIAYHLVRDGRGGRVGVFDPEPAQKHGATPLSAGGVRQLFSLPENILMSRYSRAFYLEFETAMAVDGRSTPIDWRQRGYLFVVSGAGAATLERNAERQISLGVRTELLDRDGLCKRFPSLRADDVALACYSPEDGWLDPYSAREGFRRKARSLGAEYHDRRVVGLETRRRAVERLVLDSGERVRADVVVNATGAWAAEVAAMVGMRLPVEPVRRMLFWFDCRETLEPLPFIKDPERLAFRPEGGGFIAGLPNAAEPAGFNFAVDHDYFEATVWPRLAARVPAFDAVRLGHGWAGHYAQNRLDGNMILGPWTGGLENFFVATGFSGHGVMHAPAVGLALAELLLDGGYATIDLSRLGYERVLAERPYREEGIV